MRPVVPPTVPPGEERVRVCLRADMEKETVARLVDALRQWVDKVGDGSRSRGNLLEARAFGEDALAAKAKL